MSPPLLPQQFALQKQRYRQGLPVDERAGLELFRRALQQRNERALGQLYQPCKALLAHWLLQHPLANRVLQCESPEGYALEALGKFWQATTRTLRSSTSGPRWRYLRLFAALSARVVLDAVRRTPTQPVAVSVEALTGLAASGHDDLSGEELWKWVERALPDQRERRLLFLRYMLDYRPREVVALAPEGFPSVELVYQLEREILQCLRRHPALARWKQ